MSVPEDSQVPQERSVVQQFWYLPCEEEGLELPRSSSRASRSSSRASSSTTEEGEETAQRIAAPKWRKVFAGLALSSVLVLLVAAAAAFQGFTPGHAALHSGRAALHSMGMDSEYDVLAHLCDQRELPWLWQPNDLKIGSRPMIVRVLSYNLFWWHLFRRDGGWWAGHSRSAGRLVAGAHAAAPFDLMGFQECEDQNRVLNDAGILDQFGRIQSPEAKCMAYRYAAFQLLESGHDVVAQDVAWQYYGFRGAGWMRLRHYASGATVLFINHHGPLNVGSGGSCGGKATAANLAYVALNHGVAGDVVILSGDFNAGPSSETMQELAKVMTYDYHGNSFGGVDNFFTNMPYGAMVDNANLGGAGSDHDAVSVTFELWPPEKHKKAKAHHKKAKAHHKKAKAHLKKAKAHLKKAKAARGRKKEREEEPPFQKELQKMADWADGKKTQVVVNLKK